MWQYIPMVAMWTIFNLGQLRRLSIAKAHKNEKRACPEESGWYMQRVLQQVLPIKYLSEAIEEERFSGLPICTITGTIWTMIVTYDAHGCHPIATPSYRSAVHGCLVHCMCCTQIGGSLNLVVMLSFKNWMTVTS